MMRSLFSGVSGLKAHQTRMDVIGNNIANVNTTGYKAKRLNFSDMLYQTTQAATAANASKGTGGINPRQIGLGVKTAAINTSITTPGASQSTGNPFDLKLTGDAFFVVSDGTNTYYTRDGSFDVDDAGNLVMASTGYIVQGWGVDNEGNIVNSSVGDLNVMGKSTYNAAATTKAKISKILDSEDTDLQTKNGKLMNIQVYDKSGYEYNLRFGILPVSDGGTTQRKVLNQETRYTLPKNLYVVDNSKKTYNITYANNGGTVSFASTASADLDETINKLVMDAYYAAAKSAPTTPMPSSITIQLEASSSNSMLVKCNGQSDVTVSDLDNIDISKLNGATIEVKLDGKKGYSTVERPDLKKDATVISVDDDTVLKLLTATTGTALTDVPVIGTDLVPSLKPLFITSQTYTDNGESKTDHKIQVDNKTGAEIKEIEYSDLSKLLSAFTADIVSPQFTTTESVPTGGVMKGRFTIGLLGMTDGSGKEVDIGNLAEIRTDLVYKESDGQFDYVGTSGNSSFTIALSGINTLGNFSDLTIDMSDTTNESNGGKSTITGLRSDGRMVGTMSGVSIGTDGTITANYTNGMSAVLGQVCVGTFANAMGLENAGDSLFSMTAASGDCIYEDIKAAGIGYMTSGVLEMSNVDLSQEFTDLITTQRGFQANSRTITVSDTLLEELINLKR